MPDKLTLRSTGNGGQEYSLRATNDTDLEAGGARFIVRNESHTPTDVLTITGGGGATAHRVGIGTTKPEAKLTVAVANEGDLALRVMDRQTSILDVRPIQDPPGRFQTVLDTVNDRDLVINPGTGNVLVKGDTIKIEDLQHNRSPKLSLHSHGNGTQEYSIRSTNNNDPAGGARLIIRNESHTPTDVLTITGGGGATAHRVGIGTTNPEHTLDVAGPVHATSFPTSSDIRFKTDITQLVNVLEKLENIRGVSFKWNELYESLGRSTGHEEIGLVAQEVEKVFPELVTTWGHEKYRAIDYGRLTGVLVEAVKELRAETQVLRARIGVLENSCIC